jgi:Fic family protein
MTNYEKLTTALSKVRLEQTLYAEYPSQKRWIQALEGQKSEHTIGSLAEIWEVGLSEAATHVQRLVEIGFIEERGDRSEEPTY